MIDEINSFLEEKKEKKKEEKAKEDQSNPFLALFGKYEKNESNSKQEKTNKGPLKTISPDNDIESEYLRKLAVENAKSKLFDIFDLYKKSHGMPSYT
jgi:hypothetical protein